MSFFLKKQNKKNQPKQPKAAESARIIVTVRQRPRGSGTAGATPPGSSGTTCGHCRSGPSGSMSCWAAGPEARALRAPRTPQKSPPNCLGIGARGHRDTHRVNKESLEVLGLRPELLRPRDLPFQDLVDGVHVVQVWPFGEQKLPPPRKQALRPGREKEAPPVESTFLDELSSLLFAAHRRANVE